MASPTDICNIALAHVGSKSIIDLSDESKRARLCKQFYPVFREELLRAHPWNFAIAEAELAEKVATPLFGFDKIYSLPADFLRLVRLQNRYIDYRLEGGNLHANESPIQIKYVQIIEDSERFDSSFTLALSYRLASALALPLADDNNLHNIMVDRYRKEVANARSMDAQENPATQIQADEWLDSRY
ncbi:MAG: hypothetical protein DRP45_00945 [Candidatus Zixiibacteriota bacterium]|nr:MAG: hypothetical protein DRP45_00945 [candidate division Zixibacteria bacterium]